jgi:hypothetical protein
MIGNRAGLPIHPDYVEDLGAVPTGYRIYRCDADDPYDDEPYLPWQVDGYAIVDGRFALTAAVENFATWHDALAALAGTDFDSRQL